MCIETPFSILNLALADRPVGFNNEYTPFKGGVKRTT